MKIGVFAPSRATAIIDAITDAGGDAVFDPAATDDVDALVTVGEEALLSLIPEGVSVPVLPIAAAAGIPSVARENAPDAVASLVAGDFDTEAVPLIAATVGERTVRALRDVMLVTTEPARISEYAISSMGERVAEFRADGVVVATPAGSHGYARAAGGSVVAPSELASIVPISPFAIDRSHWVLPMADLSVSVVRDEAEVELLADTRRELIVPTGMSVAISTAAALSVAVVPETTPVLSGSGVR
ncbi:ATP-NAD kinase [Haladaptatus sp. DJG-WS-42]|uniref:ATP-NAD kinase n=1 Tax=Haladaptatus sp. DJG-WS-42 TaxID=3120516 RepID=UPI0030CC4CCF